MISKYLYTKIKSSHSTNVKLILTPLELNFLKEQGVSYVLKNRYGSNSYLVTINKADFEEAISA